MSSTRSGGYGSGDGSDNESGSNKMVGGVLMKD